MKLNSLLAALALLSTQAALADDHSLPIQPAAINHFTATLGVAHGGDAIGTVIDQSNSDTTETIRAGDGYLTTLGYVFGQADFPISLQLNAGYFNEYEDSNSSEGSFSIRRKVLEAIPFYNWGPHRLGLGIALHKDITYYGNAYLTASASTQEHFVDHFDDETAPVLEYDYRALDWLSLGARASWFKYNLTDSNSESVSGAPKVSGRNFALAATFLF